MIEITLIVVDAPPLITLTVSRSLDYLLYPGLPVVIPDAVLHEATAALEGPGAQDILDWQADHAEQVCIVVTDAFRDEAVLRDVVRGRRPPGELRGRAAFEAILAHPLPPHGRALLLSHDAVAARLAPEQAVRTVPLTTADYLRQLEAARRIQSAEAIIDAADLAGHAMPRQELWSALDPALRDAVRAVIERGSGRV
jgi:hypothetical protein